MIRINNLHKSYPIGKDSLHVLKGIDLHIKEGEFVSIMGSSGSGKSTLLNIAGLLETPTLGSVNLCGNDCRLINEDQKTILRGKNIGFIFQSHRLFPEFSSLENVMLPQLLMGTSKKQALSSSKELLSPIPKFAFVFSIKLLSAERSILKLLMGLIDTLIIMFSV